MEQAFNYSKLRGKIVEEFGNYRNFTNSISISASTLSAKLNNKISFSQDDVLEISRVLGIDNGEIGSYFFTINFRKNENVTTD